MSASGLERHMLKLPVSLQRTDGPPWATGNKQRGLMQFRFHPSGIVARRTTDQSGLSKHERLN